MSDVAEWYAKRRGSPLFVMALLLLVASWLSIHALTGFDHGLGALNLILSTEASVSLAFFTMMGDRQSSESAASMRALADAMDQLQAMNRALLAMAEAQRDGLAHKSETT